MVAHDPAHVSFTFSGTDTSKALADAIGTAFDAVLTVSRPGYPTDPARARWVTRAKAVDYRVMHGTGWDIVDETTIPITNFVSGGGVDRSPL
jgi:hypothetical protein